METPWSQPASATIPISPAIMENLPQELRERINRFKLQLSEYVMRELIMLESP